MGFEPWVADACVVGTAGCTVSDGRGEDYVRLQPAREVRGGVRSIAFPRISTGVYGYPAAEAALIAIREARAFVAVHPDMEVTFCLFNGPRDRIEMKALYDGLLAAPSRSHLRVEQISGYLFWRENDISSRPRTPTRFGTIVPLWHLRSSGTTSPVRRRTYW